MSSCEDYRDKPHVKLWLKQMCFAAQQQAVKQVEQYTRAEVKTRASYRGIDIDQHETKIRAALSDCIAREMYILSVSQMSSWSRAEREKLARSIGISVNKQNQQHLDWRIAVKIVKDKLKYRFDDRRRIVIVKSNNSNK
jgi:hypothetical protein